MELLDKNKGFKCPHCGGTLKLESYVDWDTLVASFYIVCTECDWRTNKEFDTGELAKEDFLKSHALLLKAIKNAEKNNLKDLKCPKCGEKLNSYVQTKNEEEPLYQLKCPNCHWQSTKNYNKSVEDVGKGCNKNLNKAVENEGINKINELTKEDKEKLRDLNNEKIKELFCNDDEAENWLNDYEEAVENEDVGATIALLKQLDDIKAITEKLKGCPFCGKKPVMDWHEESNPRGDKRYVVFLACPSTEHSVIIKGIGSTRDLAEKDAIEKWNKRYVVCHEEGIAKQRVDVRDLRSLDEKDFPIKRELIKGWISPRGEIFDTDAYSIVQKFYAKYFAISKNESVLFLLKKGWVSIADSSIEDKLNIYWFTALTDEQKIELRKYFDSKDVTIDQWSWAHWKYELEAK